ncbi:MAG: hypothetical protein Q4G62_11115 [Pseudomonadota bacterium]|nr:hypothetical protein [Pseudomonadota bacterium]
MSSLSDTEVYQQRLQAQRERVDGLRAIGEDARADALARDYHAEKMFGLADDTYAAAAGKGNPPLGYVRGSQHPERLRAMLGVASDAEVMEFLHPDKSGFRAEIYLPDKTILGQDAKPVLAYKGTGGEIIDRHAPGGRRDSAIEDWTTANLPQGMGQQTDYYDRAMSLAVVVQENYKKPFDITGHSLGAGMASAASAVTGMPAVTVNAAGLHPETAARYAHQHGLQVYPAKGLVDAYQVKGDVLTDVQGGVNRMAPGVQRRVNGMLSDVADLLETPGLRSQVDSQLNAMLPAHARASARQALDFMTTPEGRQALKEMPVAVGDIRSQMPAKTERNGQIVDREHRMALDEVAALAGPALKVMEHTIAAAQAGRLAGRIVQGVGHVTAASVETSGQGVSLALRQTGQALDQAQTTSCTLVQATASQGGEVSARLHGTLATAAAQVSRSTGRTQQTLLHGGADAMEWAGLNRWLPTDKLRQWGDKQRSGSEQVADAVEVRAASQADDLRKGAQLMSAEFCNLGRYTVSATQQSLNEAATYIDASSSRVASNVRGVADGAPAAGATLGASIGVTAGGVALHSPTTLQGKFNLYQTARMWGEIRSGAVDEALQRHGIESTALPSLRSVIGDQETEADRLLDQSRQRQQPAAGRPGNELGMTEHGASLLNHPSHPQYAIFRGAQRGVHELDAQHDRHPDLRSDQLAGALAVEARQAGMSDIQHVMLSRDARNAIAIDTADAHDVSRRLASVDVASGMGQSLEDSTRRMAEAELAQARNAEQQQQEQQRQVRGPVMG